MKKAIILILVIGVIVGGFFWFYNQSKLEEVQSVTTFEECVNAGYPVLESYPRQCLTPDGRALTEDVEIGGAEELSSGEYVIDTDRSQVVWEGSKPLVSNYVDRGTIAISEGSFTVTEGLLSGAEFVFDMNSIATESTGSGGGEDRLTGHLKSDDFFAVETYPESRLVVTASESLGEGRYKVMGDLTIRDETHPISFEVAALSVNGEVSISGEVEVDRTLFNVRFGSTSFFSGLGDNVVADTFKLIFSLRAEERV